MRRVCHQPFHRTARPKMLLAVAIVLAIALAGCLPFQTDQLYFAYGTVRDQQGLPVPGVTIIAEGGKITTETDHLGRWTLAGLRDETVIHAQKHRWAFAPVSATVSPDLRKADFVGIPEGLKALVQLKLDLPERAVPIQDATLRIAGQTVRTDEHGHAAVYHLEPNRPYSASVETLFGEFILQGTLGADATLPLTLDLSRKTDTEALMRATVGTGTTHPRWPMGATISVYFDYTEAPPMSSAERTAVEAQALDEIRSWLRDADADNPYLRWDGRVARRTDATVTIRFVDRETFIRETSESSVPPSSRWFYEDNYIREGIITTTVDWRPLGPGGYARAFGNLLGLRYPGTSGPRSVLRSSDSLTEASDWDLLALKVKMHLPHRLN